MSTIKLAHAIKVSFASRLLKNTSEYNRQKKTLPVLLGALGLTGAGAAGKVFHDINADKIFQKQMDNIRSRSRSLLSDSLEREAASQRAMREAAEAREQELLIAKRFADRADELISPGRYPDLKVEMPNFSDVGKLLNIFKDKKTLVTALNNAVDRAVANPSSIRPMRNHLAFSPGVPSEYIEKAKDLVAEKNLAGITALRNFVRDSDFLDTLYNK